MACYGLGMKNLPLVAAAVLVFSLACGGLEPGDSPEVTPTPLSVDEPVVVDSDENVIGADHVVDRYFEDCHYVVQVDDDMSGDPIDECAWFEFDQMCAPDPSGCWDKGQSCQDGCKIPCRTCEDSCSSGCDDCKSQCDGSAGCLISCSFQREECHTTCIQQRDTCLNTTCAEQAAACYSAHDEMVAQLCPSCDQITQCAMEALSAGDYDSEDCEARFPKDDARCFSWCSPDW
jgi:hypothetical protein